MTEVGRGGSAFSGNAFLPRSALPAHDRYPRCAPRTHETTDARLHVRELGLEDIQRELAACKVRERALEADLKHASLLSERPRLDRAALRKRLVDWTALLRKGPAIAR